MLKDKFNNNTTALDKKIVDNNEYWTIENNPMTKVGVFPYLGKQISPDLEPNKIYYVLRSKEELTKPETLKSLESIPLLDDHTMVGNKQGFTPIEKLTVHGVTGANVKADNDIVTNDLRFYSKTIQDLINSGKKELSMGYTCKYELESGNFNGQPYDAIQTNIRYNHIALVDEGRMGHEIRVMDCNVVFDTLSDILQQKELNMNKDKEKTAQDVDKRELIREVMAIAAKPNEDFEGGEEEKIKTIAKKLEAMSYNPSETGANDEDDTKKKEGEDEESKKKEDKKEPVSMDSAIKYIAKRDDIVKRIRPLIGDNVNYSSMNIDEVVSYACDKLDIKASLDTLEGYLKAKSTVAQSTVSMDSMFEKKSTDFLNSYKSQK